MITQSGLLNDTLCSQPQAPTLADGNPCVDESLPLSQFFIHKVIGKEYETSVQTIMERLNWNMPFGSGCYPVVAGGNCFRKNEVGCIINAYTNHAMKKEFAPYNPVEAVAAQNIINIVQKDTDRPFHKVKAVLDQLYYSVKDGTVQSGQLLDPIKYKENKEVLETPKNVDSGVRDTKAMFDDILKYGKYGLIGIAGLGVLYVGAQAFGAFKTLKGAA